MIENENGYKIVPSEIGKCMVLTGPWKSSYHKIISSNSISSIRLSQSFGWSAEDLTFLKEIGGLRGIEIYNWDVKDISVLQELELLELIGLECDFRKSPDFSKFSKLKIFKIRWRSKGESIFNSKSLIKLNIVNFPYSDLTALSNLQNLERLQLTSRVLTTLHGLKNLWNLKILDLHSCSKLSTLDLIVNLNIEELIFSSCNKITDITPISKLKKLKYFCLEDCGQIHSINSISKCRDLEKILIIGSTIIKDGDLSDILNLPKLEVIRIAHRRHYSHKPEEIKALIKEH